MWFRKDLRLTDNTAFIRAIKELQPDEQLFCLFQLNPEQFMIGTKNHDYFFTAVKQFADQAESKGFPIHFMSGSPINSFRELQKLLPKWSKIYFNQDERGNGQSRDQEVLEYLMSQGIAVTVSQDSHLHSSQDVKKADGTDYQVFTPYYRAWRQLAKPVYQELPEGKRSGMIVPELFHQGDQQFKTLLKARVHDFSQQVGELRAEQGLNDFAFEHLVNYQTNRDYPSLKGTSGLSRYLRTGEISIRKVWHGISAMEDSLGQETFLKELAWRDFYHMIYSNHPNQQNMELKEAYRSLPWRQDLELLTNWQQGQTGYPIIDAAMMQLNQTGWMHNRLRMLVASFLTKDLLVDWRLGAAYFKAQLIDYDSASNIGGWQWAASTGTDAVPYFRIFNPWRQSEKFDPEGLFIKEFLPVLQDVPLKWLHEPHLMPPEVQQKLGIVIGRDYPKPIVDHQEARKQALTFFKENVTS